MSPSNLLLLFIVAPGLIANAMDDRTGPVLTDIEVRQARSRQLWRQCHGYLERVHYLGRSRIVHEPLEINIAECRSALHSALAASTPFLVRDTDELISDLGQRLGLEDVQRRVARYITASVIESSDPTLRTLVQAHRAWRLVTNLISDALARILHLHPSLDTYVSNSKLIMYVAGREAFVRPVLGHTLLSYRSEVPAGVRQYDPTEAVRQLVLDPDLLANLVEKFETDFPKVLKERAPDCFAVVPGLLARLWWSGVIQPKRRRPTFEQFVLGCGIAVADYLLVNDPMTEKITDQGSRELLPNTLAFDRMFDQVMMAVQAEIDRLLPDPLPNRPYLISLVMEVFLDLERPRRLLQWLKASDGHPSPERLQEVMDMARCSLIGSLGPILHYVLGPKVL